jgi:ribonuclease D
VYEHPDGRRAGLNPHNGNIACVQICLSDEVYITHWSKGTLDAVPGAFLLREMLESEHVQKVIHNAIFEHQFLMHELPGLTMRNVWDTQVGEYILAAGRNHDDDGSYTLEGGRAKLSLGDTVKRRFQHEMDKGEDVRLSFMRGASLTDRQMKYAAEDAYYCLLVAEQQRDAMPQQTQSVMKLDCDVTEAVARMMLNGFPAERDLFQELVDEWTKRIDELHEFLSVTLYMPGRR